LAQLLIGLLGTDFIKLKTSIVRKLTCTKLLTAPQVTKTKNVNAAACYAAANIAILLKLWSISFDLT